MTTLTTRLGVAVAAALTLSTLGSAGVAQAKGDDYRVIRTGSCSGNADWKLKAKQDDGRIEVEFEVDSNVNGQTWGVRLKRDGNVFFRGSRTTKAPSGSFSVERRISNSAGDDVIVGRAVHGPSGQVCRGRVVFQR